MAHIPIHRAGDCIFKNLNLLLSVAGRLCALRCFGCCLVRDLLFGGSGLVLPCRLYGEPFLDLPPPPPPPPPKKKLSKYLEYPCERFAPT